MITAVNDSNFAHFVQMASHGIPVLVDFWASWCGPCKTLAPHLEQLDQLWAGKCQIVKADLEQCPHTATALSIKSIPTLLLFRGGVITLRYVGNPGGLEGLKRFFEPGLA